MKATKEETMNMETKTGGYVIRTASRQPCYLRYFCQDVYGWTCDRSLALRLSRSAAVETARSLDAAIAANGYQARPVRVIPLTGGFDITR